MKQISSEILIIYCYFLTIGRSTEYTYTTLTGWKTLWRGRGDVFYEGGSRTCNNSIKQTFHWKLHYRFIHDVMSMCMLWRKSVTGCMT